MLNSKFPLKLTASKAEESESNKLQVVLTTAKQTLDLLATAERWGRAVVSNPKTQGIAVAAAVVVGLFWFAQKDKKK